MTVPLLSVAEHPIKGQVSASQTEIHVASLAVCTTVDLPQQPNGCCTSTASAWVMALQGRCPADTNNSSIWLIQAISGSDVVHIQEVPSCRCRASTHT